MLPTRSELTFVTLPLPPLPPLPPMAMPEEEAGRTILVGGLAAVVLGGAGRTACW